MEPSKTIKNLIEALDKELLKDGNVWAEATPDIKYAIAYRVLKATLTNNKY
jgi:hypothetical protein